MVTLLQERIISGKGLLRLDPIEDSKYRYLLLLIEVIRRPRNEFLNFKWNPPEGFYANVTIGREGYVTERRTIDFPATLWKIIPDICGQSLIAQKCALDAIFQSIINLGTALNAVPISVNNPIADYANLNLESREYRFVCYSSSALRLRLYGEEYDSCNDDYKKTETGGELPTPEPFSVPQDEPVTVSDSYDADIDGGDTIPFPEDGFPEDLPAGGDCQIVVVAGNIRYQVPEGNFFDFDFSVQVWGTVETATTIQNVAIDQPNTGGLLVGCKGRVQDGGCDDFQEIIIVSPNSNNVVVGSIEVTNLSYTEL